jgi:hypothetical protein
MGEQPAWQPSHAYRGGPVMNNRKCASILQVVVAAGIMPMSSPRHAFAQERSFAQPLAAPTAEQLQKILDAGSELPPLRPELTEPKKTDDEIMKLRKERYRCAVDEVKAYSQAEIEGPISSGFNERLLHCNTTRVLEAELALCQTPEDRVSAYSRALVCAKVLEGLNKIRFNATRVPIHDVQQAQFVRLGIEIKLLEAKEEAAKGQRK